jgi:succinoglycan biosynthesis protein ExoM
MRFGNVILRGEQLRRQNGPFDVGYGLMAGEDGDLLVRMANNGARIVWCDEALVREPVEAKRLSLRWLLQRALGGGQEFARKTLAGRYGDITLVGKIRFVSRSIAQLLTAAVLSLLTLPMGRHRAAFWLVKASANLGKLSIFLGWRYQEYA